MVCNFEIFLNRLNISYFIKLWTFCNFFDLTVPISFFDIHSIRTPIEKYWQKNVHIWFLKQQRCFKLLGYSQIGLEVGGPWGLRFIHIFKGQVCWSCRSCRRWLGSLIVSPVSIPWFLVGPEPWTKHMDIN